MNVNIGGGKGGTGKSGKKRRRDADEDGESDEVDDDGPNEAARDGGDDRRPGSRVGRHDKQRRIETLGAKKVKKEVYKKGRDQEKMAASGQWSR